jgi:hypothetical protein
VDVISALLPPYKIVFFDNESKKKERVNLPGVSYSPTIIVTQTPTLAVLHMAQYGFENICLLELTTIPTPKLEQFATRFA